MSAALLSPAASARSRLAALLLVAAAPAALAADADAQMKLGRQVFTKIADPQCGVCHTLKDAGTTGTIGANLHELTPDAARVAEAVRKGVGVMPSYEGKLTDEQIKAVAAYVAQAAKK
ncbi:MAG TPA: cytochrome c [Burkholderiales bacterium]|jgi:sulfite dehydrogenase|nr:cytochrome c [Burkholderiales bacterium]